MKIRLVITFIYIETPPSTSKLDYSETTPTSETIDIMTIECILYRKTDTIENWRETCSKMNTSLIINGSLLGWDANLKGKVELYLIKWRFYSYIHCSWEQYSKLEELEKTRFIKKLNRFLVLERSEQNNYFEDTIFDPMYITAEKILTKISRDVFTREGEQRMVQYYIKWEGLSYDYSTWEMESDVIKFKDAIQNYNNRMNRKNEKLREGVWRPTEKEDIKIEINSMCKNSNELLSYQIEGIKWLVWNWIQNRSCILADEMGLGKTIQSLVFIQYILKRYKLTGPVLVVAPLSTIENWKREIREWTNLQEIVFYGNDRARSIIKDYDWKNDKDAFLFDICLTTPNFVMKEQPFLSKINWTCCIIDEAHSLKGMNGKYRQSLVALPLNYKILLTGTPIQNDTNELYSLLNFIDPDTFSEQTEFSDKYGELKNSTQVELLHKLLKGYLLRRLKVDVEKRLKPKQETIIEVELTVLQKKYYRAIYEKNKSYLFQGLNKANAPSLMNIMMQLRKCCNHPFLIDGIRLNNNRC